MSRSVSSGGSSMGGRVSISKSQPGCPCPPPLTRRNVAWWIGNRCRPRISSPSVSICASRSHETLLPWQKLPAPTPGGPTRGQYPPHPGGTPAPSRPLPPVGVARDPGGHMLRWERGAGAVAPARPRLPLWPAPMNDQPQLSAQDLIDQMRGHYEKLCSEVAAAVNAAPAGQVINASEEKVRD